jgi:hypothetical protein
MWFILRAVFWLSAVFLWIYWPKDPADTVRIRAGALREAQDILGRTAGLAEAGVEKGCSHAPAACLEGAARLGQLIGPGRSGTGGRTRPHRRDVDPGAASD